MPNISEDIPGRVLYPFRGNSSSSQVGNHNSQLCKSIKQWDKSFVGENLKKPLCDEYIQEDTGL